MSRYVRALILAAGGLVLLLVVGTLAYAFTRGGGTHLPKYPGRIAVRSGCGVENMFFDGTDKKTLCLDHIYDEFSVSHNGDKLAWDTTDNTVVVSGVDGFAPVTVSAPQGFNVAPSLSPDGKRVAFLHSARDDGLYDIWSSSISVADAEQLTNTRNVSDVAWSPTGEWIAYIQNWSEETEEGQLSMIHPDGSGAHTIGVDGDAPDWSPDGKHLVYVHKGALWVVDPDGEDAHQLIPDGHAPAWSRDAQMIVFLRTEKCSRNICPERLMRAFANGTEPEEVGPVYPNERRVGWLPDPFE